MYHYTYLIQHKTKPNRYIGVRTSVVPPVEDSSYWGSSKHLPEDVKSTHRKIILKIHPTRKEALEHEILMHDLNDVAVNIHFYNKAKQTSIAFDTTGVPISELHKQRCREALKNRVFTEEHRQKISNGLKGKKKSEEHVLNCSLAQKQLAKLPGYKNPRKGAVVTPETRKLISDKIKEGKTSASINNNRFKPWFITKDNVTTLYFDKTKEEIAIEHNCATKKTYQDLSARSKGYLPIKAGNHKGIIIGNIEDAIANQFKERKPLLKRAWFLTYPTYSIPFYFITMQEYADANSIKRQAISDAVHLSKGTKVMQGGPFKGLVLGRIS